MNSTESLALKSLLTQRPIAALATLHKGEPAVSMVPFALLPDSAAFVIHVSRLAAHTADMLDNPAVAVLVTASPEEAPTPLALARVSIQGRARLLEADSLEYEPARRAYLAKLPDAADLFSFSDFSLVVIEPRSARYVAGFGRAMSVSAEQLAAVVNT